MTTRRPLLFSAAAFAFAANLTTALPAQLPLGHIVSSNFAWPVHYPGLGGLFFIDPATSAVTTVTNMPCELTGACPHAATPWSGPDLVVNLPDTGQILVNGPNWIGHPVSAYLLTLNGADVTAVQQYPLATYFTGNGLANPAAALLPDGRVLLAIDPTSMAAPGPLGGALLGILDPSLPPTAAGAVTAVPVSPIPPGITNGLAVDDDRSVAYVVMADGTILSIPIPGGGSPTTVTQLPGGINCLALEPDGNILAGGWYNGAARLWRVDPGTGTYTMFPQAFGTNDSINALRIDPVSGELYLVMSVGSIGRLSPRTTTGTLSTVAAVPTGGWGRASGLDMADSLRTYGRGSGSAEIAAWHLAPNPGGAPAVGNATFTLTNATDPGAAVSLWVLGLMPATIVMQTPAVELLVTPITSVLTLNGNPAQPSTLSFPIPGDPQLSGLPIFFQCAHLNGTGGVSASSGLRVTIE